MRNGQQLIIALLVVWSVIGLTSKAYGWGSVAHKFINKKAAIHLPPSMALFASDSIFYGDHASDADARRSNTDIALYSTYPEHELHFIDIDDYPNYLMLPRDLNTLIQMYGIDRVNDNSLNPWAIVWTLDSLTAQLARNDRDAVKQTASDLGHYIGDEHQPLHNTKNYNPGGLHSRYESTMISKFQTSLFIVKDSVQYISSPLDFAFENVYRANAYVDSLIAADSYAKTITGSTSSTAYYDTLWSRTQVMTIDQIQRATVALASLWYTAYVNAGLVSSVTDNEFHPVTTQLFQNYPNPFNPATNFEIQLGSAGFVSIKIFDLLGKEIAIVVNREMPQGQYTIPWNSGNLPGGVYYYQLITGATIQTRKLLLLR